MKNDKFGFLLNVKYEKARNFLPSGHVKSFPVFYQLLHAGPHLGEVLYVSSPSGTTTQRKQTKGAHWSDVFTP
jgi:hypothetical protein